MKLSKHPLLKTSPIYSKFADKYISPQNYEPWNTVASRYSLCGDRRLISKLPVNDEGTAPVIQAAIAVNVAASLDSPAIYLDPNLAEAVLQTDVSAVDTPELVLPSFFVCLPKNLLYDDIDVEINSLLVTVNSTYVQKGTDLTNLSSKEKIAHVRKTLNLNDPNTLRVAAITSKNMVITLNQNWQESTASYTLDNRYTAKKCDVTKFNNMAISIMRIVKNIILIYNYQKDLIHTVKVSTSVKGFAPKKHTISRSSLPITLLGKNFLGRKETYAAAPPAQIGTKVRPHWRKGHWHTVLTGAGRRERKFRWFQPVYVNSALDT